MSLIFVKKRKKEKKYNGFERTGKMNTRAGGSNYVYGEDPTLSVRLYSTVYYSTKTEDGREMILLTSTSGGIIYLDTTVYVSYQEAGIGCSPYLGPNQSTTKYPTTLSWSYNSPTSWSYVPKSSAIVGVWYDATIQRYFGGSPWVFTLNNYVIL